MDHLDNQSGGEQIGSLVAIKIERVKRIKETQRGIN